MSDVSLGAHPLDSLIIDKIVKKQKETRPRELFLNWLYNH